MSDTPNWFRDCRELQIPEESWSSWIRPRLENTFAHRIESLRTLCHVGDAGKVVQYLSVTLYIWYDLLEYPVSKNAFDVDCVGSGWDGCIFWETSRRRLQILLTARLLCRSDSEWNRLTQSGHIVQSEQRNHWRCVLHLGVHQYPTVPTF